MHTAPDGGAADGSAGAEELRRLYVYNGGFLNRRIRRILALSGYRLALGLPGPADLVGVWGRSPTAHRGERIAARRGVSLVRVEDAFLRSIRPGRNGEPPLGLLVARTGVHFDSSAPSDLEILLATHPLDDTQLLERAHEGIRRLRTGELSKYNAFVPEAGVPAPGYVLVIDQSAGDASIHHGGADAARFREMLYWAEAENPGARILIKAHPETIAGHRAGHYRPEDAQGRKVLLSTNVSPWRLLEGAVKIYTVSSQLGFEAILAGHRPITFGQPFYAGWGLSDDRFPVTRRRRRLTRAQLFAAAMILAPSWYDPCRDRLCSFEDALDHLEARVRAFRDDRQGWSAPGIRLWKRTHLQRFFGTGLGVTFRADPHRPRLAWGTTPAPPGTARIEDGFLRSKGLGAALVPPLSLILDHSGLYYDPTRPSDMERHIAQAATLPPQALRRAERLVTRLRAAGLSKYNLGGRLPSLPEGRRILVVGQVADDASVRLGAPAPGGGVLSNLELLRTARTANPQAVLIWKPHPDVEAGLREGHVPEAEELADAIARHADPAALIDVVDEVWTLTSLLGFEALLRETPVTCLGVPFYAGWGLTRDLGPVPARRQARPSLVALVHAALITAPRYRDPLSGQPCPVEVIVERLETGALPRPGPFNRTLSKLQGAFAGQAWLWR